MGLCEDCIEEMKPNKKLKVQTRFLRWWAYQNKRMRKDEEEEDETRL